MRRLLSITVAMYLVAISIPAVIATADAANQTVYSNEAGWSVAVNEYNNCIMSRFYDKGTKFVIGYDRKRQGFWFGFGRADWAPLVVQDAKYTIDMEFDGDRWTGTFHGYVNGNHGAYLSDGSLKKAFIVAMARSNRLVFRNHETGEWFRWISLEGSYDGLTQLFACQERRGWETNTTTFTQ